jgi:hypothetical protein
VKWAVGDDHAWCRICEQEVTAEQWARGDKCPGRAA